MASPDMRENKDKESTHEFLHFSGCPTGQEFVPECEVVEFEKADSLDTLYDNCGKNPGHVKFIPVEHLKEDDLPPEYRTPAMMREIFRSCVLTVRVKVSYTSEQRPESFCDNLTPYPYYKHRGRSNVVRFGTGTIAEVFYYNPVVGKPCPCPICEASVQPERRFWWVCVRTATHVIYDSSEARRAQFDCFYHSDDKEGVKTLYGFDTFNIVTKQDDHYRNDACHIWCVTHDHETVAVLNAMRPSKKFIHVPDSKKSYSSSKIIVSHPHGCSKRITVGKILHLTVPVGLDYPVNKAIYFSDGAKCRKTVCCEGSEIQNHNKEIKQTYTSSSHPELYLSMKKLVEDIRNSPEFQYNKNPIQNGYNSTSVNCNVDQILSRDSYMVDFYFLFIRHCSLMNLFATVVADRQNQGWGEKSAEQAVKDIFRIFLYKEYGVDLLVDTSSGANPGTQDNCLQQWVYLLKGSEEQLIDNRSGQVGCQSPFVELFQTIRAEKFSPLLDMMSKDRHACQCYVIDLMNEMKVKCTQKFYTLEGMEQKAMCHPGNIMHHNTNKNNDNSVDEDDDTVSNSSDSEKDSSSEANPDDEYENNDNDNEEDTDEDVEIIPEGSTFTLAANAEYAFRVYGHTPGWIQFHPGTVMTLPDGTQKPIGEPHYQFHERSVSLYRGFVTYNTETCPGSSGAAVKFNMMDNFSRTFFPHSGYQNGINRSGMQRECGQLVYPKLFVPQGEKN